MAWWIAERDRATSETGEHHHLEVSESAAKLRATKLSSQVPGTAFQVRYHANANAPTEVRWEALNGQIIEVTRDTRMSASERRIGVRHFACFPAFLEQPERGKRAAAIYELTATGAVLAVRAELAAGDVVSLMLHVTGDPAARSRATHARVVGIEALDGPERALWSHRVAVQFDSPLADFEAEIQGLAMRQRQLGWRP